ncbi:MAG: cell wall-active antibiotics response protein [Methanomicrobiaceae archaeon]|nr:cell wall-active antibiotics response protein [Methanomicrobiaceae archaeon]MDD5418773.1 LiaF-related protein [Methanomicrobiaceae archaeon]
MGRISYQILFGAILLILGILLLLRAAGIYDTGRLLIYIPSLFVLLGLYALWRSGFANLAGPVILIVIFGTIQVIVLGIVTADILFPIIIIAAGIGFLLGRFRRPSTPDRETDEIDVAAIFGGVDTRSTSKSFRGGDITAIFGGVDLDLRDSRIAEPPAVLNTITMFGGIDIRVPEDWQVRMDVLPILGGAEDERPRSAAGRESGREQPDLRVQGFVAFGGLSVKD